MDQQHLPEHVLACFAALAYGPEPSMKAEQSASAPPPKSDVNLFCYREGVVDLNAEISDRTFDLGVPQKELDGSQIAGSSVD